MNRYESTIIFTPVLSDEDVKTKLKSFRDLLEANGAQNIVDEHWGLKKLAYTIEKKNTGVYHLFDFLAPAETIAKLEIQYKRDESILRFMTIKLDKYGVEYADKRRQNLGKKKSNKSENLNKEEVTNE
jgi:small subunit ribosomal protein S6